MVCSWTRDAFPVSMLLVLPACCCPPTSSRCSCFWLSLVAGACDSLTLLLTGFLLVNLSKSLLGLLAVFQAIMFGCSAAAVLWNWQALRSRTAELHLNAAVMLLAGMPFYQAAKAGVLLAQLPTGGGLLLS